jgi:hypothetical protein
MAVVRLICCGFADPVTSIVTNAVLDIKSLQLEELGEKLRELGEPGYRSRQIADWLYKKRVESFEPISRTNCAGGWQISFVSIAWKSFVFSVRGTRRENFFFV